MTLTRQWINNTLIEYFLDSTKYTNLSYHKKILQLNWKAIFTTNYDISLELAEHSIAEKKYRLLPIVNPADKKLLSSNDAGKLKYIKICGCCRELEQHPTDTPPLIITQKDFQDRLISNQPFMEELHRYAYDSSIIFIGFQAHRVENNPLLANIQDACNTLTTIFHQPFRPFAVLKGVDEEMKSDFQDLGINLIEGTFQEFIDSVLSLNTANKSAPAQYNIDDRIYISAGKREVGLTRAEYNQYASQFTCFYNGFFKEKVEKLKDIKDSVKNNFWKSQPSELFLASGRYIKRSIFSKAVENLKDMINNVKRKESPFLFIIAGNRVSGKSVLALQIAQYAYTEYKQPVLILNPKANYFTKHPGSAKEINISGWDARMIDKFLSPIYSSDNAEDIKRYDVVPIIVADHLAHRNVALDHLLKYLENHGKPCILLITLNTDEWYQLKDDRLIQIYKKRKIEIFHKLDDNEIRLLFETIAKDEPRIVQRKEILIDRAMSPAECDRDILFILYMWFDKKFRRLDEIIIEEANKLDSDIDLKNLYLSIAVFHQYSFTPRISLCAESQNISIDKFIDLRNSPFFKAFVHLVLDMEGRKEYASTRHAEYSRKVLNKLLHEKEDQINLMKQVLGFSTTVDVQFIRDFLNYIYRFASFTVEQISKLKEATERKLGNDYVLNHQFASYLIRENEELETARYYLDIALDNFPDNPSIIHSLGNLNYTLYKSAIEENNKTKALEYFEAAKEYFAKSRTLMNTQGEHAYFTDIDMTRYRMKHAIDDTDTKALLNAESQALLLEALRVIPKERQNLLRQMIGEGHPYSELPRNEQIIIKKSVYSGAISPILLEYYADHLFSNPDSTTWHQLKEIVTLYWKDSIDPASATVIGLISKKAFIKPANVRFELLRVFFDKLVRYQEDKISFTMLAEYIRLISIDAFILEKYDFLKSVTGDIIDLFRSSLPRFLKDEYILNKKFYMFDTENEDILINYFKNNSRTFYSKEKALRYLSLVNLIGQERYFTIEIDPITRYFIRGIRKEVSSYSSKSELSFRIKHTHNGFFATDIKV